MWSFLSLFLCFSSISSFSCKYFSRIIELLLGQRPLVGEINRFSSLLTPGCYSQLLHQGSLEILPEESPQGILQAHRDPRGSACPRGQAWSTLAGSLVRTSGLSRHSRVPPLVQAQPRTQTPICSRLGHQPLVPDPPGSTMSGRRCSGRSLQWVGGTGQASHQASAPGTPGWKETDCNESSDGTF